MLVLEKIKHWAESLRLGCAEAVPIARLWKKRCQGRLGGLFLLMTCTLHFGLVGQGLADSEFSANLKKAAPQFEWVSSEAVRKEVIDLLANHRNKLGQWAIEISETHGLSAGLNAIGLPGSLCYLPASLGVSEALLGQEDLRNGAWQMHSSVAAKYGLLINSHIDERFDPELSVDVALNQLRDLWADFEPNSLAILAFLSSPSTVRQAQYRSCDALSCRSVFEGMEAATMQLYHRFLATVYVYAYHKEIIPGQALTPPNKMPHHRLQQAEPKRAYIAWLKEDSVSFQRQNPHLIGEVIPLGARVYSKSELPRKPLDQDPLLRFGFQRLRAKPDSLLAAMLQMKIDPELWFELNGIEPALLHGNETMLLPLAPISVSPAAIPEEIPLFLPTREPQKPKTVPQIKGRYHTVRSGETLWSIAQKYPGVSHLDIQKANRMGNKDIIQPGQKIKIPK
jgi:membrane-bound lytic murein transglycosylase D